MLDMSVENPYSVVFHEYAHQLMNGNLQVEPDPWFEEGFAEYFSSIEVDGKEARVGKIPEDEYRILQQLGMMKIADLFNVQHNSQVYNESGDHRTTFYAQSGMLVHYIFDNQLLGKVSAYFNLKDKHLAVDDAIRQGFEMSLPQFDKVLRDYASSGRFKYYRIPNPPNISSANYTSKPISGLDSNAVLADIHLHTRDHQEQALKEFQAILNSDSNNQAACRGLGYAYLQRQDFGQAAEYFKRASQMDSRDPRVHYYSALLMVREGGFSGGAELPIMTKELETSITLDPNFADSYALLAFTQSMSRDSTKALATMQKAIAINPRNQEYRFNLANIYLENRQPDQALAVLQSLRVSDNPALAARVNAMLAQARQFKEATQIAAQGGAALERQATEMITITNPTAAPAPVNAGPAKFLKGTLTNVDCATPPLAVLTVLAGAKTWKMRVADRDHLVLIGADEFSCTWSRQRVALNYRETATGEGSVISLEIQ
jgi:tetratricopeptide (TPR) repeat protein